jgi:hypothetical protein
MTSQDERDAIRDGTDVRLTAGRRGPIVRSTERPSDEKVVGPR